MLQGAPTHKYAWNLNGVVLWDHMKNKQSMYGHKTKQAADLV